MARAREMRTGTQIVYDLTRLIVNLHPNIYQTLHETGLGVRRVARYTSQDKSKSFAAELTSCQNRFAYRSFNLAITTKLQRWASVGVPRGGRKTHARNDIHRTCYTVREPCAKISIIVVMLQSRKLLFPVSGATGVVVGVHVDFPCVISTVAPNLLYLHRRQTPRRKCNQPRPDLTAQKLSNKLPSFTTHTGSHVIGKLLCVLECGYVCERVFHREYG